MLWRFAKAGASSAMGSWPISQGVTSLLKMQLSLEIEILPCPKLRLVHSSLLLTLLCLLPPQHLLGFEQLLRPCLVLRRWPLRYDQWWECKFIAEGIIDQGKGCVRQGLLWRRGRVDGVTCCRSSHLLPMLLPIEKRGKAGCLVLPPRPCPG